MNNPEYMGEALYRLHCAHENSLEAIVLATAAVVVGSHSANLDATVFAKLGMLHLASRIVYPFMYVFGPDMLRTFTFSIGGFAAIWIMVHGLFTSSTGTTTLVS